MSTQSMAPPQRCYFCQKRTGLFDYVCQACQSSFCIKCRLPEYHACPQLETRNQKKKEELAKDINASASKDTHHLERLKSLEPS